MGNNCEIGKCFNHHCNAYILLVDWKFIMVLDNFESTYFIKGYDRLVQNNQTVCNLP